MWKRRTSGRLNCSSHTGHINTFLKLLDISYRRKMSDIEFLSYIMFCIVKYSNYKTIFLIKLIIYMTQIKREIKYPILLLILMLVFEQQMRLKLRISLEFTRANLT